MQLVQRLNAKLSLDKLEALIAAEKKYKGCFSSVWLCTMYGYPKLSRHREVAEHHKEMARRLREAGICVSMQLSNSMGHGEYMATQDCSGLVYDGSPVRNMVGHDGSVAKYAFCWNDKIFKDYLTEEIKIYAEAVKPEEIWIDDDFRARNHAPVAFGCWCDDCIARFNKKHSTDFDRETLVHEFLHGNKAVRANYISHIRDGLASLAEDIARAVVEVSPNTRVGLQNGPNGPYTGRGHGYIFDALCRATDKPTMYRPGGGAYKDHNPNELIEKMYYLAWQTAMLPDYVKDICPEIESTPDTAMGKSMHGTALETALNFANGATDVSYAMLGGFPEPISFYEEGFKLFSEQLPYYSHLSRLSRVSRAGGICYAATKCGHMRDIADNDGMAEFNKECFMEAQFMVRNGIPLTYTDSGVYILHPSAARQMSNGELRELLSKNVLTDGECVEYMQSRGIDLGFELRAMDSFESFVLRERFTDNPQNKGYMSTYGAPHFSSGLSNNRIILGFPSGSEILGTYYTDSKLAAILQSPDAPYGYASVITKTASGGRWAVMAYGLWKHVITSTQRDRLLNIIDNLCGGMCARLMTPHQAVIMPRIGEDGATLSVSVTNCTIGDAHDIRIKIRNPASKSFRFISQYNGECELASKPCEDGCEVTVPELKAWSVGTVFCI